MSIQQAKTYVPAQSEAFFLQSASDAEDGIVQFHFHTVEYLPEYNCYLLPEDVFSSLEKTEVLSSQFPANLQFRMQRKELNYKRNRFLLDLRPLHKYLVRYAFTLTKPLDGQRMQIDSQDLRLIDCSLLPGNLYEFDQPGEPEPLTFGRRSSAVGTVTLQQGSGSERNDRHSRPLAEDEPPTSIYVDFEG
ncbi:MAG: hypothetical protein AAGG02_15030 [Cyanobacteria bacterium P01_H01_bin.15]